MQVEGVHVRLCACTFAFMCCAHRWVCMCVHLNIVAKVS